MNCFICKAKENLKLSIKNRKEKSEGFLCKTCAYSDRTYCQSCDTVILFKNRSVFTEKKVYCNDCCQKHVPKCQNCDLKSLFFCNCNLIFCQQCAENHFLKHHQDNHHLFTYTNEEYTLSVLPEEIGMYFSVSYPVVYQLVNDEYSGHLTTELKSFDKPSSNLSNYFYMWLKKFETVYQYNKYFEKNVNNPIVETFISRLLILSGSIKSGLSKLGNIQFKTLASMEIVQIPDFNIKPEEKVYIELILTYGGPNLIKKLNYFEGIYENLAFLKTNFHPLIYSMIKSKLRFVYQEKMPNSFIKKCFSEVPSRFVLSGVIAVSNMILKSLSIKKYNSPIKITKYLKVYDELISYIQKHFQLVPELGYVLMRKQKYLFKIMFSDDPNNTELSHLNEGLRDDIKGTGLSHLKVFLNLYNSDSEILLKSLYLHSKCLYCLGDSDFKPIIFKVICLANSQKNAKIMEYSLKLLEGNLNRIDAQRFLSRVSEFVKSSSSLSN